jgi:hypothetical protein
MMGSREGMDYFPYYGIMKSRDNQEPTLATRSNLPFRIFKKYQRQQNQALRENQAIKSKPTTITTTKSSGPPVFRSKNIDQ